MSLRSSLLKSYQRATVACYVLFAAALLCALIAPYWLPRVIGAAIAVLSVLVALGGATIASAGTLTLQRYRRDARGERDLFLELNRSREPAAIGAGTVPRANRLRRWFARRLLHHDVVVGDLVEIKTWDEIHATLDQQGCLEQLPFMPEMLSMCGKRAYVFRCVHRLFDYRKSRRMRHMDGTVLLVGAVCDGSMHGGCEAACHTMWKSDWLHRVDPSRSTVAAPASSDRARPAQDAAVLQFGTPAPRFACQLTQLHAASQPIGKWSATNFLLPMISGNVTPAAFVVGWLMYIFNEFQHLRGGVSYPEFETIVHRDASSSGSGEDIQLKAGDRVVVKSSAEIRATLNDDLMHRGMWFEPDMSKHCGRHYCIQNEVTKLIDIVTGEMRTMKTPAYILRDVHFSGERQLFNAQYEPLFWRAAWLRQHDD
jgi:hypothetical protein